MTKYFIGDPNLALDKETLDLLKAGVKTGHVIQDGFGGIFIQAYKTDYTHWGHHLRDKNGNKLGNIKIGADGIVAVILASDCHVKNEGAELCTIIHSSKEPVLQQDDIDGVRIEFDDNTARLEW